MGTSRVQESRYCRIDSHAPLGYSLASHMSLLYLKHLVATSPLAGPADAARQLLRRAKLVRHPELGMLAAEDPLIESVVRGALSRDSNCVDVGAHIGSMTRLFTTSAPDGDHMIIEPVAFKAEWLRKRFPRARVVRSAVADEVGEVTFYENVTSPGFSSMTDRSDFGTTRNYTVPCTTLDELLPDGNRVDFIKIDVEGHELSVVRGAQRVLRDSRPIILFEAGAIELDDASDASYTALFDLLTGELEYDVFSVFDYHYKRNPISLETFRSYRTYPFLSFNFVARPRA